MNFGLLVRLEPELLTLMADIMTYKKANGDRPSDSVWYKIFKPRMEKLVGMYSKNNSYLSTSLAYDCAYANLYGCMFGVALR